MSSVLANFLNSGSSNNNESNLNQDEHAIIANYSTLLSEFYHKNPHLASSPNSCSPSSLTNQPQSAKLKSNLKTKCGYDSQYRSNQYESSLSRPVANQRTGSLQRQSCQSSMSNRINSNKIYNNAAYYNNTYSNGSGAMSSRTSNAKLSPMLMQNTTRSLSESNFRTSNEAEFEYDEECGQMEAHLQEDRLLKE